MLFLLQSIFLQYLKVYIVHTGSHSTPLPQSLPTPPPEAHLRQPPPLILLNPTLLPMPTLIINLLQPTDQIRLRSPHKLSAFPHLPNHEHEDGKEDRKVRRHEAARVKGHERVVANKEQGEDAETQGEVGGVGGPGGAVGEGGGVQALGGARAVEADEGDEHHGVGHDEGGGGEVDEPEEDLDRGVAGHEEGDARDEGDGADGVDGHAGLGALEEELGGLAV